MELYKAAGWVAAGCAMANAVASAAMVVWIGPGTAAGGAADERFRYLLAHPLRWTAGWCLWMAAAVSLLLFYVMLALTLDARWRRVAWSAVAVAGVGIAPDIAAELIAILTPPEIAAAWDISGPFERRMAAEWLLAVDREMTVLTGFVANGLYTAAGLVLNAIAFKTRDFPRWLAVAGLPVWAAGFGLCGAALSGSPDALRITTSILMPLFVLWAYGVAAFFFWGKTAGNDERRK